MSLFNALPGACAQGLIWGIMAIGVYITYKILDLADLTVDGTMATGGAVWQGRLPDWLREFFIRPWEARQFLQEY